MKANELMIGDYISVKPSEMPIKVAAVHHKKVAYHAVVNKLEWVGESLLKPIPLTPEILEKNGFKLNPQGSYSIGRNISIDTLDGRYNANINTNNPKASSFLYQVGKYVHELQHALRLCGIDKEIEL